MMQGEMSAAVWAETLAIATARARRALRANMLLKGEVG
jgi:hypothetical protein